VFHTLIVHFENGVALQCEDRFVNPACAPDYLHTDFTQITPTHYLLHHAPLWEAQYSIEAGLPTAREARLLGIPCTSPA
jgi:GntR family histidine utilization transcriptional repressor